MMKEPASERRLAENEVVFRNANEKVLATLEKTLNDKQNELIDSLAHRDLTLYFYCECANYKCRERIKIPISEYEANHRQSNQFIVLPGHEKPQIEHVVKQEPAYFVVQKYFTPPADATKLNPT